MRFKLQTASLRETTAMEYAKRFLFGGLVTVIATLVANKYGPIIGGLFLAFPGIFPAAVSLVEKHKTQREMEAGKDGTSSARAQASVEAAGASAGAIGLAAFALVIWKATPTQTLPATLTLAFLAWAAASFTAWIIRDKLALLHHANRTQ